MTQPDLVVEDYLAARQALASRARDNIDTFVEFVLRDEATGKPVVQSAMHSEWQHVISCQPRVVLQAFRESGKTQQAIARVLWTLGRNPSARCIVAFAAQAQSLSVCRAVSKYLVQSAELHLVFPHLRPGDTWQPDSGVLTVERPHAIKDPSLLAVGTETNLLGRRADLLICDDLVSYEGGRTPTQREKLVGWFFNTPVGTLTAEARAIVIGTPQHPDDLLGVLARSPGWFSARFGIEDEEGNPRWPEQWPAARIAAKREELGPLESAKLLDCLPRSDEDATFKGDWIAAALARGRNTTLYPSYYIPRGDRSGYRVVVGVDLGVAQKETSDLTAITTLRVHPDGTRQLLALEAGRWDAPTIIANITSAWQRYSASVVVVETAGQQDHLRQFLAGGSAIPVRPFKTGRGEMSLGWQADQLALEMHNAKWILPSGADGQPVGETAKLVRALLYHSPAARHTDDRLASLLLARWGAAEGEMRVESFHLNLGRR